MQYNAPTYRFPPTVPERLYPAGVYVERTLRVWAISRWRGARELTEFFLAAGFRHLPRGSPRMYHLEEVNHNGGVVLGSSPRSLTRSMLSISSSERIGLVVSS